MSLARQRVMRQPHSLSFFGRFARWVAGASGRPGTFVLAAAVVLAWGVTGPLFGFSDAWQLVINTGTTIVTFLMVFLIQNTQNRDGEAIQAKLDELLRALAGAHAGLIDLEQLDDAERARVLAAYAHLAREARAAAENGGSDTEVRDLTI
jgi:low affinity Fe/Cu permease